MTPEQMAKWVADFIKKNNAKLSEEQRQNFQLCQQILLTQKQQIDDFLKMKA